MKKIFYVYTIVLALSSVSAFAEIPVLSIDELGNEQATMITDDDYAQVMLLEAETSARAAEDHLALAPLSSHLLLKGVLVGLEAQGNVGVGAFKVGAGINQQFYFEINK